MEANWIPIQGNLSNYESIELVEGGCGHERLSGCGLERISRWLDWYVHLEGSGLWI